MAQENKVNKKQETRAWNLEQITKVDEVAVKESLCLNLNPQPEYQLQVCGTTGEMMAPSRGGDQGNSEASWNFPAIPPDHDKEGGKVI